MSDTKHTPGPWIADTLMIFPDNGDAITHAIAEIKCRNVDDREPYANAHLIAAAPDMLEALEYALNQAGLSPDSPTYKKIDLAIKLAKGQ